MPTSLQRAPKFAVLLSAAALAVSMALPLGAGDSGTAAVISAPENAVDWDQARSFWAFRPPQAHSPPKVRNKRWVRQPLDAFILAGLEGRGLAPSPEADKRVLIRRLALDLTGLPPTPQEVRAFLADQSPAALENLVETLLASPRFGERMASLWLNVARYAEDQAHQVDTDTKNFYPNAWRYRAWVIDAFNRDLPYDQFIQLQLAADTIAGGNQSDLAALGFIGLGPKYYNRDRLDVMADEWEDRVDTVTRSFLGLTAACARCHDHKYDPITTQDYYALAGVFASTKMVNKTPDGQVEETPKKGEQESKEPRKVNPDMVHVVEDGTAQNLNVLIRGNVDRKGPVAERRFLRILSAGEPPHFNQGSGRGELAGAIASRENPLTARVMVNRVWGLIFGHPLVESQSNFGSQGQRPTHPELLDDLATRFMNNGWSIKKLIHEMVLSAAYRQSSHLDAQGRDPENKYLSRMNRRRLPVEMWRDSLLAVAGELEETDRTSFDLDDPQNHRRTVYARVSRLKLNDLLMQFDYPDANVHAEKRSTTTTAIQKLFVLNSPFLLDRARALAGRLTANPRENQRARVKNAYELLYSRPPTPSETKLALEFLSKPENPDMPRWQQYAHALLAANEMMYVD